jgi:hypothetical protein
MSSLINDSQLSVGGAFSSEPQGGALNWLGATPSLTLYRHFLDASKSVPTADENRPHTANISIKIHRGWM